MSSLDPKEATCPGRQSDSASQRMGGHQNADQNLEGERGGNILAQCKQAGTAPANGVKECREERRDENVTVELFSPGVGTGSSLPWGKKTFADPS